MRSWRLLLVFLVLTLPSKKLYSAQHFKNYRADIHGIRYQIDPRIELYNIVCMLFGHNGMTQHTIAYKQQVLSKFARYKKHPAVNAVLNTFKKGWVTDDPIFFMLCLDSKFRLGSGLSPEQIKRGGGFGHLQKLAALFGDFAAKTGFYDWFNHTQRPFYQQVIQETAYNFKSFKTVKLLEQYFGERHDSYTVILNLLSGYGNFGRAFTRRGSTGLYAVIETTSASGSRPVFAPGISLFNLIVHEFSHGFVNPALDPIISSVDPYTCLYEPISKDMRRAGYHSWRSTVYETIVPAVVIRIAKMVYGEDFARKNFYNPTMARGFAYTDAILDKLMQYEQHRMQYVNFRSFAPELLTAFANLQQSDIDRLLKKIDSVRRPIVARIPKPHEFARDKTSLFIVGTHEPDLQAQASMHTWVRKYHGMIAADSPLITDDEALNMDLTKHDLVVFGTPAGNSFLKRHLARVPIVIDSNGIRTTHKISGKNLQLVTAWVNPFNDNKVMVIYSGQQTADIVNFHYSPHKDQHGYWVAQNTITLDKGDYVNHWGIWSCDPSR